MKYSCCLSLVFVVLTVSFVAQGMGQSSYATESFFGGVLVPHVVEEGTSSGLRGHQRASWNGLLTYEEGQSYYPSYPMLTMQGLLVVGSVACSVFSLVKAGEMIKNSIFKTLAKNI